MDDLELIRRFAAEDGEPDAGARERVAALVDRGIVARMPADGRLAAAHPRRSRARRIVLLATAATAVLVLGVALAVSRQAVHEFSSPPVASAAEVAANVRMALSRIHTLRGEQTAYFKLVKGPPKSEWRPDWTTDDWWARARIYSDAELKALSASGRYENSSGHSPPEQVVVTADGRWRKEVAENAIPPLINQQIVADEATGVMKWYSGGELDVIRDRSLGSPDQNTGVALMVVFLQPANLAAMAHGRIGETTVDGRPALTVSCAVAPQPITGLDIGSHLFDTIEYTVDRATWLVVRESHLLRGQVVFEVRLTKMRIDEPVGDAQFTPFWPKGTTVKVTSEHFRRVPFGAAAHVFAAPPLAPGALPEGFRPFAAAVTARARFTYWTPTGYKPDYWPASRDVTQLSYRSGLLRFLVTTRTQPAGGPAPADPFVADPFVTTTAGDDVMHTGQLETVQLTGGAWSGVTAHLVMPVLGVPHLWAWHEGTLITVAGDLTRSELLSVANSLQPLE